MFRLLIIFRMNVSISATAPATDDTCGGGGSEAGLISKTELGIASSSINSMMRGVRVLRVNALPASHTKPLKHALPLSLLLMSECDSRDNSTLIWAATNEANVEDGDK